MQTLILTGGGSAGHVVPNLALAPELRKHFRLAYIGTDGIEKKLAERAGISLQTFANHSDIPGGSTLGNLSARQVAVKAADVGVAQLAMHSPYETCGSGDTEDLVALARALFSASLEETGSDCWTVR